MRVLTNVDIIRIVNKWQKAGFVNVMTCATDGCKSLLEPIERKGEVLLKCPACVYEEKQIPQVVLDSEERIDGVLRSRSTALATHVKQRRKDFIFALAAWAGLSVLTGSFLHPVYGTSLGLLIGLLIVWLAYRNRS